MPCRIAPITVLLAGSFLPPQGAEVTGRFTAGGQTIEPQHAAAFVTRSPRDARRRTVEVVLSVRPIDPAAAAAALAPHTQAINQDGLDADYVLLWVDPDGAVAMNATFAATMSQYLVDTSDGLVAELQENTPLRVAGRIHTPKPLETMSGERYQVDLRFAAAVAQPPAAQPLPAGGGEPGAALVALLRAIASKDWPAIQSLLAEGTRADLVADYRTEEENRDWVLDVLGAWLPKENGKVTGGELRGEVALLEVEGEVFEGMSSLVVAQLKNENGKWVFEQAQTVGFLD